LIFLRDEALAMPDTKPGQTQGEWLCGSAFVTLTRSIMTKLQILPYRPRRKIPVVTQHHHWILPMVCVSRILMAVEVAQLYGPDCGLTLQDILPVLWGTYSVVSRARIDGLLFLSRPPATLVSGPSTAPENPTLETHLAGECETAPLTLPHLQATIAAAVTPSIFMTTEPTLGNLIWKVPAAGGEPGAYDVVVFKFMMSRRVVTPRELWDLYESCVGLGPEWGARCVSLLIFAGPNVSPTIESLYEGRFCVCLRPGNGIPTTEYRVKLDTEVCIMHPEVLTTLLSTSAKAVTNHFRKYIPAKAETLTKQENDALAEEYQGVDDKLLQMNWDVMHCLLEQLMSFQKFFDGDRRPPQPLLDQFDIYSEEAGRLQRGNEEDGEGPVGPQFVEVTEAANLEWQERCEYLVDFLGMRQFNEEVE